MMICLELLDYDTYFILIQMYFFLCYAVNSKTSYTNAARYADDIKYLCPGTPIILCAMKIDLRKNINEPLLSYATIIPGSLYSFAEGIQYATKLGAASYIETSIVDGIFGLVVWEGVQVLIHSIRLKTETDKCLLQ